jgi:hypothetical protein
MDHVTLPIVVRKATAGDVASMQAVEVAARQRFRAIDDPRIARSADDPPYQAEGLTGRRPNSAPGWRSTTSARSLGLQWRGWLTAKATSTNWR